MLALRALCRKNPTYLAQFAGNVHTSTSLLKQLPPRLKIDENEITENFIKGGGAGGQKINKTSSRVQLIHHPTGIQVNCQASRSRAQNRTLGRRMLAERIEELQMGDKSRTAIKAAKEQKKKASSMKKKRRKYRKLAEEKGAGQSLSEEQLDEEEELDEESAEDEQEDSNAKNGTKPKP